MLEGSLTLGRPRGMDYDSYLIWKALGLIVLAFLVNFFYTLFTGRRLGEPSDTEAAEQDPSQER